MKPYSIFLTMEWVYSGYPQSKTTPTAKPSFNIAHAQQLLPENCRKYAVNASSETADSGHVFRQGVGVVHYQFYYRNRHEGASAYQNYLLKSESVAYLQIIEPTTEDPAS